MLGVHGRTSWEGNGWGQREVPVDDHGSLTVFGGHGYEAGYARAKSDALSTLLLSADEFLRGRAGNRADHAALRHVVETFREELEKSLAELSPTTYVEGGLGI
ncbi:MAG TPA: hypothetical protein VK324_09875 [Tepidisphaeraceae bacterium]|nr:hypothetical protein [Tepidisphaeraceae bacterium]